MAIEIDRHVSLREGGPEPAPLRIAVIGVGYWGPNLVRNFLDAPGSTVTQIYDIAPTRLEFMHGRHPSIRIGSDYRDALRDPDIDAVCIATPAATHYTLAREALLAGKHVWVEKPFSLRLEEARELSLLALKNKLVLMVDHIYVYTPAVKRIKEAIESGQMGELLYYDSIRVNLGRYYDDVNVVGDLATHDFALIDYLLPYRPVAASVFGDARADAGRETFAYVTLHFNEPFVAHLRVSWQAPDKARRVTLCGSQKMLVFDDGENVEKLKLFDHSIVFAEHGQEAEYRRGAMYAPELEYTEPLQVAVRHFAACVANHDTPLTGAAAGSRIVAMFEASQRSLQDGGRPHPISYGINEE